ncbi:NTPase, partial [Campylobacter coli]|nr:NTPase [Campylobacter coli]EAK1587186.1 NTPase [Campylobacter coli]EAL1948886.1 NTPase [Campylobacter coli]ECZ8588863.1 NTPase [Campylobacter coli]
KEIRKASFPKFKIKNLKKYILMQNLNFYLKYLIN